MRERARTRFVHIYLSNEIYEDELNGLFGGAIPGGAVIKVGIHTGKVPITVELAETAPPLDESWEEIVEAPCVITGSPVYLHPCIDTISAELPHLPEGVYRARFCAVRFGMNEKNLGEDCGEHYALFLWLDDPRPDEIVKQTSSQANYWHRVVAKRNPERQ